MTENELAVIDKSSPASVIAYLDRARTWLATAVEMTSTIDIAIVKAEIATAAEATKQLHLSKDIQLDAQEMVRRAEYALGKSIRKGQAEGTIVGRGQVTESYDRHSGDRTVTTNSTKDHPTDFASAGELGGSTESPGIYTLADSADPEQFEAALGEAKAEGNVSRRNVLRKVAGGPGVPTRESRAQLIRELAEQNYSSRQMPAKVGVTEETVRKIARDFDIEIPADRTIAKTRRHDSNRIVAETVSSLEGLTSGVRLVDYDAIDTREIGHWLDSLADSMRELNRFHKRLKEM